MRREENQEQGVWKPVECMFPEGVTGCQRPSGVRTEDDP